MTTFYISDLHFGHEATCTKFKRNDGTPLRPFSCAQEMDEEMVRRWNSVVSPSDKVYVLGDVAMKKQHLETVGRCHGKKTLIRGNHDIFEARDYLKYFSEIHGVRYPESRDFVMSHIPLHPGSVAERYKFNVHGHLHANRVMRTRWMGYWSDDTVPPILVDGDAWVTDVDPMYFNVSVEQIDFTPISHDDLMIKIREQQDA